MLDYLKKLSAVAPTTYTNPDELYRLYVECGSLCTDTRSLLPGQLYVALKGPNFNGNAFAIQALEAGAAYAVVDEPQYATHERCLLVEDGLEALQWLARMHRRAWGRTVIGLTGSNGKTTTKELLYSILSREMTVLATPGNLNNHIGLPLTLLQLQPRHRLALLEMGDNKTGDIAELCHIAEPNMALITNIGQDHLQGYEGGMAGNAATKCELYEYVSGHGGTLFVNLNDPWLAPWAGTQTLNYGPGGRYHIEQLTQSLAGQDLLLYYPGGTLRLHTPLPGAHNAENVLLAATVALHLGIAPVSIQQGVAAYSPQNNRSQLLHREGKTILLDAYNANPSSMEAALHTFFAQAEGPLLLVLGDMLELGDEAAAAHHQLGLLVAELTTQSKHPVQVLLVGELMKEACTALPQAAWAPDVETARPIWQQLMGSADYVLLKGSRGIALERLLSGN